MKKLTAYKVKLSDIDLGDRARESYPDITELALSIKSSGLMNPITLADKSKIGDYKGAKDNLDDSKPYLLLAGGRRYFAFRKEEISDEIDARIYDKILTPEELKTIELEENLQRVGLTWAEEVRLKKQIHSLKQRIHGKAVRGGGVNTGKGHSVKDTAEMLEQSESSVIKDIKLADALEKMPQLASAKTKSDAQKMLRQLGKDVNTEKKANEITKRRSETPVEKQRKKLYDSYIVLPDTGKGLLEEGFFKGVKGVQDGSIDIVEIDPPYAIDLQRQKKSHSIVTQDYNEVPSDDFTKFMQQTLKESYRVMKNHSFLILWFGPDPWFQTMLDLTREAGFHVRGLPGIWSKGRGQTQQPAMYLANSYEMFFYARKGKPGIKKQGRINIFDFPPVNSGNKIHPTERPVEMIEEVLRTFGDPGANVMIPFLGSGNSLLSASNLGMKAFGYEISRTYKERFVVKVDESQPGAYRSYGG